MRSVETAGREKYRHNRSSLRRWCAWAATPACNEKPLALASFKLLLSSSRAATVCKEPTVGALGEGFAARLGTKGDTVSNGVTQQIIHGRFIHRIQLQVTVLNIPH
jgi:hypothetical protein